MVFVLFLCPQIIENGKNGHLTVSLDLYSNSKHLKASIIFLFRP